MVFQLKIFIIKTASSQKKNSCIRICARNCEKLTSENTAFLCKCKCNMHCILLVDGLKRQSKAQINACMKGVKFQCPTLCPCTFVVKSFSYIYFFERTIFTSGSRGLGGPAPSPKNVLLSCSFEAILRETPLFWVNFGLRAPFLEVKTPLAPRTKILDPRLVFIGFNGRFFCPFQDEVEEADDGSNEDGSETGAVASVLVARCTLLPTLPHSCFSPSCHSQ